MEITAVLIHKKWVKNSLTNVFILIMCTFSCVMVPLTEEWDMIFYLHMKFFEMTKSLGIAWSGFGCALYWNYGILVISFRHLTDS